MLRNAGEHGIWDNGAGSCEGSSVQGAEVERERSFRLPLIVLLTHHII